MGSKHDEVNKLKEYTRTIWWWQSCPAILRNEKQMCRFGTPTREFGITLTRYNYKPPTTIKHWQKNVQCICKARYQGEAVLHKWLGILKNKMWTPVEYIVCSSSWHFANQISSPLFSKMSHDTQCVSWEMFLKKCLWFLQVMSSEMSVHKISTCPKAMLLEAFIFACSWNNAPFRCNAMPRLHWWLLCFRPVLYTKLQSLNSWHLLEACQPCHWSFLQKTKTS